MDQEKTIRRNQANADSSDNINKNIDRNQSTPKEDKTSFWKPVVVGGVAAVAMGFGASVAYASINDDNFGDILEEENSSNEENNNENIVIPDNVPIAESVNDDMSFSEAFAAARDEVGVGGVFEWNGNMYNTYTADEWKDMTPEERSEFSDNFVDAMRESQSDEEINEISENTDNEDSIEDTDEGDDDSDILVTEDTDENDDDSDILVTEDTDENDDDSDILATEENEENDDDSDILATEENDEYDDDSDILVTEENDEYEVASEILPVEDSEIEVLGVDYGVDLEDGVYAEAIATVDVDGETVYMIDVDGDGEFDAAANDFGLTDLPDTDMNVDDMQEDLMIDELLAEEGSNGFDDMPDYMNDADISDFA